MKLDTINFVEYRLLKCKICHSALWKFVKYFYNNELKGTAMTVQSKLSRDRILKKLINGSEENTIQRFEYKYCLLKYKICHSTL